MAKVKDIDQLSVNTIRLLAVDMVEKAKSGHPGMPLGAAPMAYVLWHKFLRHNPANPDWFNRDRFILSAGHGSAFLYALLHLTGYDLSLEELKDFRQWGSKTPGHPEHGLTPGVEATTGPLGQGFAMGVGMALVERFLASDFNRPGFDLVDHYTYAIVSDGDLMEGVAAEAASLAGHLKLGKIVYLYDDNHISIEGDTALTFTEDVGKSFQAYGWQVLEVADGNDLAAIEQAIAQAREETEKPSLIKVRTHIGYGSPKQDNASSHGAPLGEEELRQTKQNLGFSPDEMFCVPPEVLAETRQALEKGKGLEREWNGLLSGYADKYAEEAARLREQLAGKLPGGWENPLPVFKPEDGAIATRVASGKIMNAIAPALPNLIGGSADLGPSNNTVLKEYASQSSEKHAGRNIHFGVREHAMGAVVNGMALHGGVLPYAATFFIFSDYLRPSLRLAALMELRVVYVFTHDSIAVGEDGPTHQPIEQLSALRIIPGLTVLRPADANETVAAWRTALTFKGPVVLILTRQNLPVLDIAQKTLEQGVARGGYIAADCDGTPELILIASGSELQLALAARIKLAEQGKQVSVVSLPSWELFAAQTNDYRDSVLPPKVKKRLGVEMGISCGWERYLGDNGAMIAIDRFGVSAPGDRVVEEYGFSVDNVVKQAMDLIGK